MWDTIHKVRDISSRIYSGRSRTAATETWHKHMHLIRGFTYRECILTGHDSDLDMTHPYVRHNTQSSWHYLWRMHSDRLHTAATETWHIHRHLIRDFTCRECILIGHGSDLSTLHTTPPAPMSHVTYEWVISYMNESCYVWMSHVSYGWVMSHGHVT